jgi:hypothetical protein
MTDFWDFLPGAAPEVEIVQRDARPDIAPVLLDRSDAAGKLAAMRAAEDRLLDESLAIVDGVLQFADVEPGQEEPDEELVMRLGLERARKAHRLARVGWAAKKDAPVGIAVAQSVMLGIIKARATEKQTRELNVIAVQVNVSTRREYDVIDDDGGEG